MLTAETFLASIESFLKDSGMSATAFGKAVANDPNFVADLRGGRMPGLRLVEKAQTYMATGAEPERQSA